MAKTPPALPQIRASNEGLFVRPETLVAASLLLAVLGAASCARVAPLADQIDSGTQEDGLFEQRVTPFPVTDRDGHELDFPFLGGLNIPRPQLVDIDQDGDVDLFLQEDSGDLKFFEQVADGKLLWRTDRFEELDVGEWFRFVDMDEDGDQDLLCESPLNHIRYFRNVAYDGGRTFELAADTLKDSDGNGLFSDRQNIPNVTDIDADGLLDLFIGRLDGTVMRYEVAGANDAGIPYFQLVTDRFEDIEIVAQFGTLHGANTLAFADVDGDSDQDLFWGDFFEPGILLIQNTGSPDIPVLRGEPVSFPPADPVSTSGYNAPAFGDIDADGDLDLFVGVLGGAFNPTRTSADNFLFVERTGPQEFNLVTERYLSMIDVGSESLVSFGDIDTDGDFDMFVSNKIDPQNMATSVVSYYENVGDRSSPVFRFRHHLDLPDNYHYAPVVADLDADGSPDLLVGTWNKGLDWYEVATTTTDSLSLSARRVGWIRLTRGSNCTPTLGDVDEDGDLDLFVGEASGALNFYRNEGTPSEPDFELVSDEYLDIDVGRRSAPVLFDIDRDADLDLLVGSETNGVTLYRNDGSQSAAEFVADPTWSVDVDRLSAPVFVDIDADGDPDLFSGTLGGGVIFFERTRR